MLASCSSSSANDCKCVGPCGSLSTLSNSLLIAKRQKEIMDLPLSDNQSFCICLLPTLIPLRFRFSPFFQNISDFTLNNLSEEIEGAAKGEKK